MNTLQIFSQKSCAAIGYRNIKNIAINTTFNKLKVDTKIPRNLSLRHLRAFVCVADCESFTVAAKKLSISQPALTLNIHQLEDMIGTALFNRTTRSVALSPLGKEFQPLAQKTIADFESSILVIRNKAQQLANRIDVAVLPSAAIRLLPLIMRSFGAVYPQVKVQMHDDNARGVHHQILDGRADIGISNRWGSEPHPDLEYTPFIRDRVGLICRYDHALANNNKPLKWSCLASENFVGMTKDTGIHSIMKSVKDLPDSISNPAYEVLTMASLAGLVESGNAISALPALAAPDYLNPGLVYRDIAEPVIHRDLCLITARHRPLSQVAEALKVLIETDVYHICSTFPNNTVMPA